MSAKRVAGGRPTSRQGKRRKALAADRPPEGLGRKGSPSPEAARGEKGGGNLARRCRGRGRRRSASSSKPPSLVIRGSSAGAGKAPTFSAISSSVAPGSSASRRTASAASNQASFGSSSGGAKRRVAFAHENGERKGATDPIDRRHERADHRLAAKVRAQPIAPDRRAVVGLDPRVAQHLLRHRHARLQPRLPSLEEPARRVHADEIALGGELSEKSGGHGRQSPFGHLNCLSAGMLRGLAREDDVN